MKKLLILFLSSTLILLLVSCGSSSSPASGSATQTKPERRQTVDAYGTIQVKNIESINIDFPATVDRVNVSENQKVNAGDVLYTLDLQDYKTQIQSKEIELNTTLKDIARIKHDILTKTKSINEDASSNLNKLSNDLQKLNSDLINAQKLYQKSQEELMTKTDLYKAGSLSQSDIDESQKLVDSRKKDIDDINFEIKSAKLSIEQEKQRLVQVNKQFSDTKKNDLEQLQVSLDQDNLKAATLRSDITLMSSKLLKSFIRQNNIISNIKSGVVYEIGYTTGDIIDSQKKLLSIADLSSVFVEADVPEDFIKDVKIGADVTINPVADSTKEFKGKVISIANKAFDKNGDTMVAVDIAVDNRDELILPGFNVNVSIDIK